MTHFHWFSFYQLRMSPRAVGCVVYSTISRKMGPYAIMTAIIFSLLYGAGMTAALASLSLCGQPIAGYWRSTAFATLFGKTLLCQSIKGLVLYVALLLVCAAWVRFVVWHRLRSKGDDSLPPLRGRRGYLNIAFRASICSSPVLLWAMVVYILVLVAPLLVPANK